MALILKDRVLETSNTTGTGSFTLLGATTGFTTFSASIGNTNTTYYTIENPNTTEWEVGIGTVSAGSISRDTVLASSTGSKVSFTSGTKNVFCDYPAGKSVYQDSNGLVTVPNLATNSASNLTPVLSYNASNSAQTNGATVAGSYLQNVMQNKSGTTGASTNFAVSNDLGTDSTYYGEFGMNSSVFSSGTPADYFSLNNGIYFSGHDGDVTIGSGNGYKTYLAWGTTGNSAHVINASGAIGLNTNITGTTNFGTAGQVLASGGSGATPTWVTSPAAGAGGSDTQIQYNNAGVLAGNSTYTMVSGVMKENGYNFVSQADVGTSPNQLPLNQYLGTMAYEDKAGVVLTGDAKINTVTVGLGGGSVSTNTAVGLNVMGATATGAYNVGVGANTLPVLTSGTNNTACGYGVLNVNTTGANNTGVGYVALLKNISGAGNTAVGSNALFNTTVGSNTAVGFTSLYATTTGNSNTSLGYQAGYGAASANANTTGSNNTYIGYQTVGSANNNTNEMVIGYTAVGLGSNTTVIGNSSTTRTKVFGAVETTGYTVATLPTGVVGMRAYVTNALTPTYGSAVVGGGAVTIPVFYNGTTWIVA